MSDAPAQKVAKFAMPDFLVGVVESQTYAKWLHRKAMAHVKRDRLRGRLCSVSGYKTAIHLAVIESGGRDAYTGESLHWHLLSLYRNDESREGRHAYRSGFALLPSVDHELADDVLSRFRICAWRTNDAKNDLSPNAFVDLCVRVLQHAGWHVTPPDHGASC